MRDEDVRAGVQVEITSDRLIAGRSWRGQRGVIVAEWKRGEVPDWVVVRVRFGALAEDTVDLAYPPAELEPVAGEQP